MMPSVSTCAVVLNRLLHALRKRGEHAKAHTLVAGAILENIIQIRFDCSMM